VRCASATEWEADSLSSFLGLHERSCRLHDSSIAHLRRRLHLRHWRFRRDEGKVECQAFVYFTEAAQKLGASEAEANNLYP